MTDQNNGKGDDSEKLLYCSFCGKSQHEVRKLIAGPSVFICDECVDLCNEILEEELDSNITRGDSEPKKRTGLDFKEIPKPGHAIWHAKYE